jgi:hypothetical protein
MRVVVVGHGFALFRRERRAKGTAPSPRESQARRLGAIALAEPFWGLPWEQVARRISRERTGRFDAGLIVQSET